MDRVDCLLMGHLSLDEDESTGSVRLGGAVAYAGVAIRNLGYRVGVVTAARPDVSLSSLGNNVALCLHPSPETTKFHHSYTPDGRRRQVLLSRADDLGIADVPQEWRDVSVVLLAPIFQEIDPSALDAFSSSAFVGLTLQGWLRTSNTEDGTVAPLPFLEADRYLSMVQAVVFSLEDVAGDWSTARRYAQTAPLAVVTVGGDGAVLFQRDAGRQFATRPADIVDATGAGDVFAAAFFLRLYESNDPVAACRFANVMASFSTEGVGWAAVPPRSIVDDWLAEHPRGAK